MLTLRRTPFGYYENGSKPLDSSTHGTHSLQLITSFWDALRGFWLAMKWEELLTAI